MQNNNYRMFIWHAAFLALASSFMDIDTIMPAMIGEAGGTAMHIGLLVTIMLGGSSLSQILFAPYLHNKSFKKKFLLLGINLRVSALIILSAIFFYFKSIPGSLTVWLILIAVSLFSFSGAFANISYTDMLGKSIMKKQRKSFLSLKQIISSVAIFISAIAAGWILSNYGLPENYSILFIFAAVFLAIASYGFWRIKEPKGNQRYIKGTRQFLSFMKRELRGNKKLVNYLLLINTLGISLSLMPFLMLYAKEALQASVFLGNILIIKVMGGVLSGFLLFRASKKFKYTNMLYIVVFLSLLVLLSGFFAFKSPYLFYLSFFFGGIMMAVYTITINGILLEISSNENRAIYTGLVGAGNIIPAIFPLFGGLLITIGGFWLFFLFVGTIITASICFIIGLNCKH